MPTADDLRTLADECVREGVVNSGHHLRQMAERLRRMADEAARTVDVAEVLRVLEACVAALGPDDRRFVALGRIRLQKRVGDLAARLREMQAGSSVSPVTGNAACVSQNAVRDTQTAADQIAEGLQGAVAVAAGSQPAASITVGGHWYVPAEAVGRAARDMREAAAQVGDAYRAAMVQAATETSAEVMNAVVRTAGGIAREIRALPLPGEAVGGEE